MKIEKIKRYISNIDKDIAEMIEYLPKAVNKAFIKRQIEKARQRKANYSKLLNS